MSSKPAVIAVVLGVALDERIRAIRGAAQSNGPAGPGSTPEQDSAGQDTAGNSAHAAGPDANTRNSQAGTVTRAKADVDDRETSSGGLAADPGGHA